MALQLPAPAGPLRIPQSRAAGRWSSIRRQAFIGRDRDLSATGSDSSLARLVALSASAARASWSAGNAATSIHRSTRSQVALRQRPEVPRAAVVGIDFLGPRRELFDCGRAPTGQPIGIGEDDLRLCVVRTIVNHSLVDGYDNFWHLAEGLRRRVERFGRRPFRERFELIEQDADVPRLPVRIDVGGQSVAASEGAMPPRRGCRNRGGGGHARVTRDPARSSQRRPVGKRIRGCLMRDRGSVERRVAPNRTSGDTLGVRRHDRDVVPPASTSGILFPRRLSDQVQASSAAP